MRLGLGSAVLLRLGVADLDDTVGRAEGRAPSAQKCKTDARVCACAISITSVFCSLFSLDFSPLGACGFILALPLDSGPGGVALGLPACVFVKSED